MKKISVNNLNLLYSRISNKFPLYLPLKKADEVNYGLYTNESEVSLFTLRTNKSPKDVFFPQSENLMKFKIDGQKIEVMDTREVCKPFVVMGVKGCDLKAFDVLDRVFLVDPLDTYYETKREAGVIITLACGRPDESCFCYKFGVDPAEPTGDVTTWHVGDFLYWRSNTEKGKDIESLCLDLFEEDDGSLVEFQKKYIRDLVTKLPLSTLNLEPFKDKMLDIFHSDKWKKLSEACIGCGTCTFVCPTCQCFDIREFKGNDGEVSRFRCWDSCMYADFTKTAGGQPRPTQMQRYRQRFMHKLVYFPENNDGMYSCVGCGRCLKKCPQSLNIAKVIKEFGGKDHE